MTRKHNIKNIQNTHNTEEYSARDKNTQYKNTQNTEGYPKKGIIHNIRKTKLENISDNKNTKISWQKQNIRKQNIRKYKNIRITKI